MQDEDSDLAKVSSPNCPSKGVRAKGDFEQAAKLQFKLTEIIRLLFIEGNPAGVKCALEILHICKAYLRLPLVPVSNSTRDALAKEIERAKLIGSGVI